MVAEQTLCKTKTCGKVHDKLTATSGNGTVWSFRDPGGSVILADGRVFRVIHKSHEEVTLRFVGSAFFGHRSAMGDFPVTSVVRESPSCLKLSAEDHYPECILEHHCIPFPVYPHEWTPTMLYDAGLLTIDLAEDALSNGWNLKDATPWNVLYSDGRPVFCDVLSFEPRTVSGIWGPYAQFQRTFVLPLYAHAQHAWSVHALFADRRDGLDPSMLARVVKGWRRWAPFELQTIILPALLSRGTGVQHAKMTKCISIADETLDKPRADFILRRSLQRLRKQLSAVRPQAERVSQWINYEGELHHYSSEDHALKSAFVREALSRAGPGRTLDIGANAGEYSLMAAEQGASVVAADFDAASLDKLYERVKARRLPITPMVLNIARPTPAVGWNNQEIDSFLIRARGQFRMIMVLALLHHLIVAERVPLEFVINLLFELNAPILLIEWVDPEDVRFRQIANTHGNLYSNLSDAVFAQKLESQFRIVERLSLASRTRTLYLCERR